MIHFIVKSTKKRSGLFDYLLKLDSYEETLLKQENDKSWIRVHKRLHLHRFMGFDNGLWFLRKVRKMIDQEGFFFKGWRKWCILWIISGGAQSVTTNRATDLLPHIWRTQTLDLSVLKIVAIKMCHFENFLTESQSCKFSELNNTSF